MYQTALSRIEEVKRWTNLAIDLADEEKRTKDLLSSRVSLSSQRQKAVLI